MGVLLKITNTMETRPYIPSNGTEGEIFMSEYCYKCYKYSGCTILTGSMVDKQPKQWIYKDDRPTCTSFNPERPKRKKKPVTGMNKLF